MITFKTTVLVAIPEHVARWGLIQLIDSHAEMRVVGEADALAGARELCTRLKPEVVIVDPAMRGGFTFIGDMRRWSTRAQVVAFTGLEDAASVERAFSAGACGYVSRLDSVAATVGAVLAAARGQRCIGPRLEHALREWLGAERTDHGEAVPAARAGEVISLRAYGPEHQTAVEDAG